MAGRGVPEKIDLKKRHGALFAARAAPALIDVPALPYLMVGGAGAPGGSDFAGAVAALYATAYAIKFAIKKAASEPDYGVAPLEALWWSADGRPVDPAARPDAVRWTAMVMQPDFVAAHHVGAGPRRPAPGWRRRRHPPTRRSSESPSVRWTRAARRSSCTSDPTTR